MRRHGTAGPRSLLLHGAHFAHHTPRHRLRADGYPPARTGQWIVVLVTAWLVLAVLAQLTVGGAS